MNPLAQLNDITTPDSVSAWPLAWGWWVALFMVITLMVFAIVQSVRHYKKRYVLRLAKAELANMTADEVSAPGQYNALLKRVAIAYTSRTLVANLHGNAWHQFLTDALQPKNRQADFDNALKQLTQNLYDPSMTIDKEAASIAEYWLQNVSLTRLQRSHTDGGEHV